MAEDSSKVDLPSRPTQDDAVSTSTNPRGIPTFPFMSSVSDYVHSLADVSPTLNRFQEMISKYTFMQQNVEKRKTSLQEKVPEMKNTLETVRFLQRKRRKLLGSPADEDPADGQQEVIQTTFELNDTLYAKAEIRPRDVDEVYLWLGANVMVAYPLQEAEELLEAKLTKARESLQAAEEDLEFLRVQITTLEVATARVYNWDVGEKRRLRKEGKLTDADEKGKEED